MENFGAMPDGSGVELCSLDNGNGVRARVMTYGAILVSLEGPDRDGKVADVALGFETLDGYLGEHPYFGATVGRFANRIGHARFRLDGVTYELAANDGANHLHGGVVGFDKVLWAAEPLSDGVRMTYRSIDGEEGYPGNLDCTVTYRLDGTGALTILFQASTDKATPVNLTHHSYFNLKGQGRGSILDHELTVWAGRYTPVSEALIPTGELRSVVGTPMDFRDATVVGDRADQVEGGYDHNYVLDSGGGDLALAARARSPESGRVLEVSTTEPGIQFYAGNFLDGTLVGKQGATYGKHAGFCLEPQRFPDSPNQPAFPSAILRPGQEYRHEIVYALKTDA
jgi:aldose 1-epimerase